METSDPSLFGTTPTKHGSGRKEDSHKPKREPSIRHSTPIKEKAKGLNHSAYERELDTLTGSVIKSVKEGKIVAESSFQRKNVTAKMEMVSVNPCMHVNALYDQACVLRAEHRSG